MTVVIDVIPDGIAHDVNGIGLVVAEIKTQIGVVRVAVQFVDRIVHVVGLIAGDLIIQRTPGQEVACVDRNPVNKFFLNIGYVIEAVMIGTNKPQFGPRTPLKILDGQTSFEEVKRVIDLDTDY